MLSKSSHKTEGLHFLIQTRSPRFWWGDWYTRNHYGLISGRNHVLIQRLNKSNTVHLSLTQADIDQVLLLTLPSRACRKLQFPSCQAVITKALRRADGELKNPKLVTRTQFLVANSEKVFDSIINLWLKTRQKADTCGEFRTQTGCLVEMRQQEEVKVDIEAHLKDESTFEIVF